MLHRIRLAMQNRSLVMIGGTGTEVEVDETFVCGAARFMHADKRKRRIAETGTKDKVAVMGMLERGGEVRAAVVLLKRQLKGTYISVEPFHLFRYLDEQVFRYNLRTLEHDGLRFQQVASQVIGKRLADAEVTRKVGEKSIN